MGQLHSAGSCVETVSEEQDRWLDISTKESRQNSREEETVKKDLESFFSLDKSKIHSVLISSLRNTLNSLEHLIQKLKHLPLLRYSQASSYPEWVVDDCFTLEETPISKDDHPIVASANSLKESLKDARQLLEDFSFVSSNIKFQINTTIQDSNRASSNQTATKQSILEDRRFVQAKELIDESQSLASQKMRLRGEPFSDQEIDDFLEEPFVLTESIIIFPSNERVKSAETCLTSNIAHFDAASTIYPNDKTGNIGNWSMPEAEFIGEAFVDKKQLNVKDTDRTCHENDPIKGPKSLTQEQRDDAIMPSKPVKSMNETEFQANDFSDLEFSEKTLMKPEVFFPWRHGLCETIEEEEEEEEVDEELVFDVSICSSPRSDLIFDSLQGENDDPDDNDDDGLLEQLADLRDDPDYEALVANETSSIFTKQIESEPNLSLAGCENAPDDLKPEITEIPAEVSDNAKTVNNRDIECESTGTGMSSEQRFEIYGDFLSGKILKDAFLDFNELVINNEIEKPDNDDENYLITQNSISSRSGFFGHNFKNFLKEIVNDILYSGVKKASDILLSKTRTLSDGARDARSNLEEHEAPEVGKWLFRRHIELLNMDRENRMNIDATGIHLSHRQGYILLKEETK